MGWAAWYSTSSSSSSDATCCSTCTDPHLAEGLQLGRTLTLTLALALALALALTLSLALALSLALTLAPALAPALALALALALPLTRYLAIILACFATEHEESKQAAKQAAKRPSVRPDFSAAYKRASARWKSAKLGALAEEQGSAPSTTGGRLSTVAMEAAAVAGVGLNAKLARRKSSSAGGHGSAAQLEAGAVLKEASAAKKPRKSMERQPTSFRARPPPAPKPEELMSEDQAALALQNKWRQHEARVLAKSIREYRNSVQLRNSRAASFRDPLHLDVSVPVRETYTCTHTRAHMHMTHDTWHDT